MKERLSLPRIRLFLVRLPVLAAQPLPPTPPVVVSHRRLEPATRRVQPCAEVQPLPGASSSPWRYRSNGKTKLRTSPSQPPEASLSGSFGPLVLTTTLPFWLDAYQRWPSTGSIRETMPSPPNTWVQAMACGSPANTATALPLSWKPAATPALDEFAKFAVMSP